MTEIRTATPDDADIVSDLYVRSWNLGFGHLLGERDATPERLERWRTDLADPAVEWFVAVSDGVVVGFAGVGASRDPFDPAVGELQTIAVDPQHWRRGIGRRLMDESLARLALRYRSAVVWTASGYACGSAFYAATGWSPGGRNRRGGTEVAFVRTLP